MNLIEQQFQPCAQAERSIFDELQSKGTPYAQIEISLKGRTNKEKSNDNGH